MILLWGLLEDETFASVHDALVRRGADVAFINHAAIARTSVVFRSFPHPELQLSCGDRTVSLEDVSAAYLRPYDHRLYACDDPGARARSPADVVHHLLGAWANHARCTVINRASAEATNQSKLGQALTIEDFGFLVPESLVTNDVEMMRSFAATHGSAVYKSMSSVRSVVKEFRPSMLPDAGAGKLGPAFLQERIFGRNIRVHVIRDEVIACAIESDVIDYRYGCVRMAPFKLPDDVEARCRAVTEGLGLVLAGIDLILTPDGRYYCLEVNPNPAFACFEAPGSTAIADAVASVLNAP